MTGQTEILSAADLLEHLRAEGTRLADAAAVAGLHAAVPACDWTVRELIVHVGGAHRWAAAIVSRAEPSLDVPEGADVGRERDDSDVFEWFRTGHQRLLEVLAAAPDDLACAAFLPASSPKHFWIRRQCHETAMHRVDAEGAAGSDSGMDAELAQDGIAEMLEGFAARRSNRLARAGVLGLECTDGACWRVDSTGERNRAERLVDSDDGADAVVSGTSSALSRWLWNRPAEVSVRGDAELAGAWRQIQVRWS